MKLKIFFLLSFSLFFNYKSKGETDSLSLFLNILNSKLNLNETRCFQIKASFKPITLNDTLINFSVLKVFASAKACEDSIREFYLSKDSTGFYYHLKKLYLFNSKRKTVGNLISNSTIVEYLRKGRQETLYFPLIACNDAVKFKRMDYESFAITEDSAFYRGVTKEKNDSSYFIRTISFKKRHYLSLTFKEEFTDTDSNVIQVKQYQIEQIDCNMAGNLRDVLPAEAEALFNGYSFKEVDIRNSNRVRNIKEGSDYLPWKGILENGDVVESSKFKNGFLILDFWYMHCYPCWKAITELSEFKNEIDTGFIHVIGINPSDLNRKADAVKLFMSKGGNYPVIFDTEKKIIKDYEVFGYPTIFVVNIESNKIIFCEEGYKEGLSGRLKEAIFNQKK